MSRRTWVYPRDGGEPYEVGADWKEAVSTTTDGLKFELEGVRGQNGERFSTRGQFDRYLSKNDLALHSDTAAHVERLQEKRRSDFLTHTGGQKERVVQAAAQAYEKLRTRGKR